MEVNDFEILLIDMSRFVFNILKLVFHVLIKMKKNTNIIGTVGSMSPRYEFSRTTKRSSSFTATHALFLISWTRTDLTPCQQKSLKTWDSSLILKAPLWKAFLTSLTFQATR